MPEASGDNRAALLNVRDSIAENTAMAQTLLHMLHDLTGADDGIPDGLDINDPRSRVQRKFACLDALQDRLGAISACNLALERLAEVADA